jgi:integrase
MAMTLPEILSLKRWRGYWSSPPLQTPLGVRPGDARNSLRHRDEVSELVQLPLNQVNLEGGYVVLYGKGSKERMVPLGPRAITWITRFISRQPVKHGQGKREPTPCLLNRSGKGLSRQISSGG